MVRATLSGVKQQLLFLFALGPLALSVVKCGGQTESSGGGATSDGGHGGGTSGAPNGGSPSGGAQGGGTTGGVGGGGLGGTPPGGGGFGGKFCDSAIGYKGCLVPNGNCGMEIDESHASLLGVPSGCYELTTVSKPNVLCPPLSFSGQSDGGPDSYAGCCTFDGNCGYLIDASFAGGPYFGCEDTDIFDHEGSKSCANNFCATCAQNQCQVEVDSCAKQPDCNSIMLCRLTCSDTSCINACETKYPGGAALFEGLTGCLNQYCSTYCK